MWPAEPQGVAARAGEEVCKRRAEMMPLGCGVLLDRVHCGP
jgi:hypothetical protein